MSPVRFLVAPPGRKATDRKILISKRNQDFLFSRRAQKVAGHANKPMAHTLPEGRFQTAIRPASHCKTVRFAAQESLFRVLKQAVSQSGKACFAVQDSAFAPVLARFHPKPPFWLGAAPSRPPGRNVPYRQPNHSADRMTLPDFTPLARASRTILPLRPALCTKAVSCPLKAGILGRWKRSRQVGSPLAAAR